MATKTILVLRHAEKTGDPRDADLSSEGQERAKLLKQVIPDTFGMPDKLFASAISKHSARPYETLEPLSKKIGVPIDSTIADQDYGVLVEDLLALPTDKSSLTVVCWHHGNIPRICHLLGAKAGEFPNPWDPDVFNLILKFKYNEPKTLASVSRHTY